MSKPRLSSLFACTLALALAGCPFDFSAEDDGDTGDTDEAAAAALTNGASFENGELIVGVMPETTLDTLTLTPPETTSLATPGETTLMSFEATNPDQSDDAIVATLLQFAGADDHFEVNVEDETVQGDTVSFEHSLMLEDDVCEKLCNRTFDLDLQRSSKTKSGGIGRRSTITLRLDCRETGDADRCAKRSEGGGDGTSDTGGNSPIGAAGAVSVPADRPDGGTASGEPGLGGVEPAFFRSADQILSLCLSCADAVCQLPAMAYMKYGRQCKAEVLSRNATPLAEWLGCLDDYYAQQELCTQENACGSFSTCDFFMHDNVTPHMVACGPAPDAKVQAELDTCDVDANAMVSGSSGTPGAGGADAGAAGSGGTIDPGTCAPRCMEQSADICSCNASCAGAIHEVVCAAGTCSCLTDGANVDTFTITNCTETPALEAWKMCGFP
jgi:hypothetical protein